MCIGYRVSDNYISFELMGLVVKLCKCTQGCGEDIY